MVALRAMLDLRSAQFLGFPKAIGAVAPTAPVAPYGLYHYQLLPASLEPPNASN